MLGYAALELTVRATERGDGDTVDQPRGLDREDEPPAALERGVHLQATVVADPQPRHELDESLADHVADGRGIREDDVVVAADLGRREGEAAERGRCVGARGDHGAIGRDEAAWLGACPGGIEGGDPVFAQNRERRRMIEQRALDDTGTDLPDRRSFFGGDRFLSPGPVDPGIKLPTGATWRPMFFAFGTLRSAVQLFNQGPSDVTEWANRLDLYGELALSGTERVLVGLRPFDYKGAFSGYTFGGGSKKEGWVDELNLVPQTLFFEGDFGELFPYLDPHDKHSLDYQFSIGRQPLLLQDGMMANDTIDGIGITRHNIYMLGASNTRLTGWFGLNEVNRGNMSEDKAARLYALSSTFDYADRTIEADAAYVSGDAGDGAYVGLGHIQRFGHWGSTLRANASWALDNDTPAVGTGYLLTHELSRTMPGNSDIVYLNTYLGIDNYTSAARGPATGGPLGRFGLMNRSVGLGSYGAPLSNKSGDTVGASLGYQHFFDALAYKQLLVELGVRTPYGSNSEKSIGALGAQYQWGFGRGLALIVGGFGTLDETGDPGYGVRSELLVKF